MDLADRALIARVGDLAKALTAGGLVRLRRERNPDQLTEDLRDLGHEFTDLGAAILTRVADLDHPARWHSPTCHHCATELTPGNPALRLYAARYRPRQPGPDWTMTADWTDPIPSPITLCEPCWTKLVTR